MARVAINGLSRIGRAFLKAALTRPELEVVAVNDVADPASLAYLLRFDSVQGRYAPPVAIETDGTPTLVIGHRRIRLLQQRDPSALPWTALDVDVVVEATGVIESFARASAHLEAGARRVVLTAPAKDADTEHARTVLMGVNEEVLASVPLSSNGSCTTNSAAPVIHVLHEAVGVRKAMLNTVHGYTTTQSLVDSPARGADLRRGRAAAVDIVSASTGAAIAVTRAIPELTGRFDGIAMRVPVVAGSLSAISFLAARRTTVEEINAALEAAPRLARWEGILAVTGDQLVSTDIVGDPHAAIVDLSLTTVVDGDLCCVYSWYDNEAGYAHVLQQHVLAAGRHIPRASARAPERGRGPLRVSHPSGEPRHRRVRARVGCERGDAAVPGALRDRAGAPAHVRRSGAVRARRARWGGDPIRAAGPDPLGTAAYGRAHRASDLTSVRDRRGPMIVASRCWQLDGRVLHPPPRSARAHPCRRDAAATGAPGGGCATQG